ncbi:MAG: hypothetical protein HJJLKODD_00171 [Phycisphaerae bacterium]|nr:hypothetical protein [Phycisphaerae bacterium]
MIKLCETTQIVDAYALLDRLLDTGIPAMISGEEFAAAYSGLMPVSIWIRDAEDLSRANQIVEAFDQQRSTTRITVENDTYFGKCNECGYDLRGHQQSGHCPECGADFVVPPPERACPHCQKPVPVNFEICWYCGSATRFTQSEEYPQPPDEVSDEPDDEA